MVRCRLGLDFTVRCLLGRLVQWEEGEVGGGVCLAVGDKVTLTTLACGAPKQSSPPSLAA